MVECQPSKLNVARSSRVARFRRASSVPVSFADEGALPLATRSEGASSRVTRFRKGSNVLASFADEGALPLATRSGGASNRVTRSRDPQAGCIALTDQWRIGRSLQVASR